VEGLQRLERSAEENNREYVFRLLRYHIMTLKLPPGTVIKENEIARQLNLSRTPVHEAVLMLKEQYLMDVLPQSGSKVSLVDINIMREGYFLRKRIEPEIIRQLAGNTPPEILKRLHDNLEKQKQIPDEETAVDQFFMLDDEFHQIIYEAAGKEHIWTAVKNVSSHFDRVRYMDAILMERNRKELLGNHDTFYQMLLVGISPNQDLDEFYDEHIGAYKKKFSHMLEVYPEYFMI
jgi:DNA-binding GntR family transcriptional regulator